MLQKECAALDCRLRPNCTTCFCLFFNPARCPRNAHEACANWNFLFPSQNFFLLFLPSAVDVRLPGLFCPRLVSFWPADRSPSGKCCLLSCWASFSFGTRDYDTRGNKVFNSAQLVLSVLYTCCGFRILDAREMCVSSEHGSVHSVHS